ncbi:MAG: hypothetical protein ACOYL3_13915 [Desulfuromonadaceae bacterium]
MRKEKVLKNRKKTEEEDELNGLGRKRMGGRRNKSKKPRKRLFQITGGKNFRTDYV